MSSNNDIVVSTRIRLARNLKNYPFTCKLSFEDMKKVEELVKDAILKSNCAIQDKFFYIDMSKISKQESVSLVERHLVSPQFISNRKGRALLLMKDQSVSIMINEEDHIRLQVIKEGFELDSAYIDANNIDTILNENLNFAFDEKFGYLTECPTNLGTGMRASLMLHLPMLNESAAINKVSADLSKFGITMRGTYGEGSKTVGSLYQLSNQVTLGLSEQAAISNLKDIALQLISHERKLRLDLPKNIKTLDVINRSLGILKYSKLLSNDEAMNLISNVRLGISIGVISGIPMNNINKLINDIQPATLTKGENIGPEKRDEIRANVVRERLFKNI